MDTMAIMISLLLSMCAVACVKSLDLQLLTIATNSNDGLRRYTKSADKYGYKYKVLGMGQAWDGGDIDKYPGGGQKINILKEGLKDYAQQEYLLVMFTDSFDVILTNTPEEIIRKFQKLDARVVFSAEGFCWPDTSLAEQYPKVKPQEKRFLNSGGFIGYAKDVFEMVNHRPVNNRDDDQLYYTSIFLDKDLREKWNIKLDVRSEIFQNLNGALDDVQLKSKGSSSYLYNVKTGTTPVVIHGNGPIKPAFNRLANYLADGWTQSNGCQSCLDETISLEGLKEDEFPSVTLAYMVETPTPFLEESLIYLKDIDYPKSKIDLFIHNKVEKHESLLQQYVEVFQSAYHSVTYIPSTEPMSEPDARNKALEHCLKKSCQYFFNVDSIAQISREETLKDLIQQNRTVLAPMMPKKYKLWSNFWGALNKNGFYSRSEDYIDILEYTKIGLWNVPFISVVYLVHGSIVPSLVGSYADNSPDNLDPDMAFCRNIRQMGTFMFVSNREKFGHQVETENYAVNQLYSDFYDIFNNPWDWERRYIHVNYSQSFNESIPLAQPCPDVFWFPIVSDKFTDELIGTMESFGRWSGGRDNHKDERLSGGYENVPTVDIHMNQVGLEPLWLHFLKRYVSPLQARAFAGYVSDPPRAVMNFVVRYRPDEQPLLRPHHDASTFTINIGLNTPDKDYTGGGCRFIRYDCSVTATRKGWMLMHPGRLTHYHEGLPTKSGTRYIMVSFVDP